MNDIEIYIIISFYFDDFLVKKKISYHMSVRFFNMNKIHIYK